MLQEEFTVSITEETEASPMLQEETKFFRDNLEKLVDRYTGKLVLIKGSRLVGVFETQRAAFKEGTRMFGLEPFLIRRVGREADEFYFHSPFNAAPPEACACSHCSGRHYRPLYQACA